MNANHAIHPDYEGGGAGGLGKKGGGGGARPPTPHSLVRGLPVVVVVGGVEEPLVAELLDVPLEVLPAVLVPEALDHVVEGEPLGRGDGGGGHKELVHLLDGAAGGPRHGGAAAARAAALAAATLAAPIAST